MEQETSFWPQRAVKEALALRTASELVRAQGWGRHWLVGGEGLSHKLGSTEPGLEAARRSESACVCARVSCGLPLVPGL